MARLSYLLITAILLNEAAAFASTWTQLHGPEKFGKICTAAHTCQVEVGGKVFNIELLVTSQDDYKVIDEVIVSRRVPPAGIHHASPPQSFQVRGMNQTPVNEVFEIYQVDGLMPGRTGDFAIHISNSPKAGPVYEYFLYDSKTQAFIQSNGPYPRLNFDVQSHRLVTDSVDTSYVLGQDLKIRADLSSSQAVAGHGRF